MVIDVLLSSRNRRHLENGKNSKMEGACKFYLVKLPSSPSSIPVRLSSVWSFVQVSAAIAEALKIPTDSIKEIVYLNKKQKLIQISSGKSSFYLFR